MKSESTSQSAPSHPLRNSRHPMLIKRNLTTSILLTTGCIVLLIVCAMVQLYEFAVVLAILGLFQSLIATIWWIRYKRINHKTPHQNPKS